MTDDHEFEQFFKDLQMKNDLDNFIKHDECPSYFKRTTPYNKVIEIKQKYPVIDVNIEDNISYNKNYYNEVTNNINNIISKCNETIKVMCEKEPEPETCPICFCVFEEYNYVIPKCKHKVCTICFTNNIKYNKHTGDCCVLCRKRIC